MENIMQQRKDKTAKINSFKTEQDENPQQRPIFLYFNFFSD